MEERYIASVDLGTSKFAVCVARVQGEDIQVVYYKESPSQGIRYSYVFSPLKVEQGLRKAITEAQQELKVKIQKVIVGLPRYYVRQETASAETERPDPESWIREEEVKTIKSVALESYPLGDSKTEVIYGAVAQSFSTEDSLNELETMAYDTDASALSSLGREMALVRVVIVLQTIGIIIMVWITSRLGIRPVLNAVDQIKADSPISEAGANEFRYLARAYNKMYEIYKSSLERLNFKASHDELTGAYNRAGYELLLTSVDLNWTYMLLFDIDNFKGINDTYGHETGDRVLTKLVQVLRSGFRSDDYICRIGGDEFIVFMVHSNNLQQRLIARKIEAINKDLADTDDGLPPISVSVGIVHGSEVSDLEELFEKTDAAMYHSKQNGKSTYTFS